MRLDIFIKICSKSRIYDLFSLPNSKLNSSRAQVGQFNHICSYFFFSTLIYFSPREEQELWELYMYTYENDKWEAFNALTPTQKM